MSIRLSMEVPVCRLQRLNVLADLDFALAHKVLEDPAYATYYRTRVRGRKLILDNSVHELGTPLSPDLLLQAARCVNADFLIAPDNIENAPWTLQQYLRLRTWARSGDPEIVGVICGDTLKQREELLDAMQWSGMVCLPFRKPRLEWWEELPRLHTHRRIHLLGVSTLDELRSWTRIAHSYPDTEFSVDTAKPIKAALLGRRLDDGSPLRGLFPQRELLELQSMTFEQERLARENIISLLRILQGEE
jgi:hypothetical protein